MAREVIKIKSDNPSHNGYYTQWKDLMKPGDIEYMEGEPVSGIQLDAGNPPAEPIKINPKPKNKRKKVKK